MKKGWCWILTSLLLSACAASVFPSDAPQERSTTEAFAEAAATPDAAVDVAIPVEVSMPDVQMTPDVFGPPMLFISLTPTTPLAATIPRNATGVRMFQFDTRTSSTTLHILGFHLRRVGVGAATDIANVYYLNQSNGSVTQNEFRYSTGRAIDPMTQTLFIPVDERPHANVTVSHTIAVDFAPATPGANHAFEIVDVMVEGPLLRVQGFPVRGNMMTIGNFLATQITVQRGPNPAPIPTGSRGAVIGNFRLVGGREDGEVSSFSVFQSGSIEDWRDLTNLTLWRNGFEVTTLEWSRTLNHYVVLVLSTPIVVGAGAVDEFSILADVMGPSDRTIRLSAEYPVDIHARDRALNAPAAVCISSALSPGCERAGQGSFDGTGVDYTFARVVP